MPTVKNKKKLCETSLSDFSIEQIDGVPFYGRYPEMERLFRKLVPSVDFARCFAQPYENKAKGVIEWHYIPSEESPSRISELSNLDEVAYGKSIAMRDSIIKAINSALNTAGDNERKFLNAALSGIESQESDSTTFFHDDQILFGVWGMRAKQGRKIEDVIREDVLDHRVFNINYRLSGEGTLSFLSIGRKYGHKLAPSDVPQVTPSSGWKFTQWEPDIPQGATVMKDMVYTAICEKVNEETNGGIAGGSVSEGKEKHRVIFNSGECGVLKGQTTYLKEHGDMILSDEIPKIVVDEGAEFLGWEPDPNGYVINSDTVFNAKYRKSERKKFKVVFSEGEHGKLQGQTEYEKYYEEKVSDEEIPKVEPEEGYRFIGWDKNPQGYEVKKDTEFIAQYIDDRKTSWWGKLWGVGAGCLNWLLTLLLLGLIGFLLWYLLGNHNMNFCGCNCDEVIVTPDDEREKITPLPEGQCGEVTESGGDEGIVKPVNMGQKSGTFLFEYDTYNVVDRITIYNGKNRQGKPIFQYEGGTHGTVSKQVVFDSKDGYILVEVEGVGDGTSWVFKVNCPEN